MKQCFHCGANVPEEAVSCQNCGTVLPPETPPASQSAGPAMPQPVPPPFYPAPQPRAGTPWYPSLPAPVPQLRRVFSWADVCTILGFASSVIGYFWASLVLLPLGLVTSLIGFKGNKTRALAVAGIVVSAIGLLIKLMMILNDASWLPYWITNGIW